MKKGYIVLDLETTGLSKSYHKITEIAAIKVKNHEIVDQFETLVNPETRIPSFITRLTGINNEMVQNQPKVNQAIMELDEFIEDLPIIAHNASFDYGFIEHNYLLHLKKKLNNDKICTRKLANRLVQHLPHKKLSSLCYYFNIKNDQAHRAMSDVLATHKVFENFLKLMKDKGYESRSEVIKFEKSKIQRKKYFQ